MLAALAAEFPDRAGDIKARSRQSSGATCARWFSPRSAASTAAAPPTSAPIDIQTQVLPRAHGSALFQRGETQGLVVCHPRHPPRRAARGIAPGRVLQELHAPLQLPRLLGRRSQAPRRRGPSRNRPRHPRRARPRAGAADRGELPLHHPHRVRHPGVARLLVDGLGVRRFAGPHGRRREDQGPRGRHRHGHRLRRFALRDPVGHQRHRRSPRRHGLQGLRHREGHHVLPDGHQAARHHHRDDERRPDARPRKAACTSSAR